MGGAPGGHTGGAVVGGTAMICPVCGEYTILGELQRSPMGPPAGVVECPRCQWAVWQSAVPLLLNGQAPWAPTECAAGHRFSWEFHQKVGRRIKLWCGGVTDDGQGCNESFSGYPPGQGQGFLNPDTPQRSRGQTKWPVVLALVDAGEVGVSRSELAEVLGLRRSQVDGVIPGLVQGGYATRSETKLPMPLGWSAYRYFATDMAWLAARMLADRDARRYEVDGEESVY